jgi:hypothetical protein
MAEDLTRVADAGYCCIYETRAAAYYNRALWSGNKKVWLKCQTQAEG